MAARLLLACLAALVLAAPAHAATRPVAGQAPTGLRGFLLRADEPKTNVFARTPSFAWNPVPGALRYEFQLSMSAVFREGGIVYTSEQLTSPAASIPISLPWITGSPYSLYARVRAVLPKTITPWSERFGFNMRWSALPAPVSTYPGLLRWSPVEGATAYDVWYLFPDGTFKIFRVNTNVADQREWYTFHQGSSFTASVKWRIRAARTVYGQTANGLPATSVGPWSPIYTTANLPFTTGALALNATISDALSTGAAPDAHRLMPAFVFSGNTSLYNQSSELYRVYVFTDKDCINVVHRGSIVGSPAYAPRPYGPLSLPQSDVALVLRRTQFLASDGDQGATYTFDNDRIKPTESEPAAAPYTPPVPAADPADGDDEQPTGSTGSTPTEKPSFQPPKNVGAPIDLWDTGWPNGRYYWTVVPVRYGPPLMSAAMLVASVASGSDKIDVAGGGFAVNDAITIGTGITIENVVVVGVSGTTLTVSPSLKFGHGPGESVSKPVGTFEYRDLELAQETCAAGRVLSFGKTSEPVVTASAAPYASGLSPTGRLIAAAGPSPAFYGTPLVAWTPALGAGAYQVQVSKRRYPFRAVGEPLLTYSTSVTLPLKPGTWWYRVRGINFSVPTGAQPMSWSDPAAIRVARPTFKVVGDKASGKAKR